ncbi:hypothetical protein S83_024752 [Arachis hypogaea]
MDGVHTGKVLGKCMVPGAGRSMKTLTIVDYYIYASCYRESTIVENTYIHTYMAINVKLPLMLLVAVAALHYCAAANCTRSCGSVSIPFPFGTTKECSLAPEFLIYCTKHVPHLQDNHLRLRSIDVDHGELRVSLPVASDCYFTNSSSKGGKFFNNETDRSVFLGNYYSISTSQNLFTTVGCETLGLVVGSDSEAERMRPFPKTCLSYCDRRKDAKDGECTGTGCCNTSIPDASPQGLSYIYYSFENSILNNSEIFVDFNNPCGYAFVVEKGEYKFDTTHLKQLETTTFPVVLDWSVGNLKCKEAQKKPSTYACKAHNSTCHDSTKRRGYLCKCSSGFQGNAYLPHGCKDDVDECKTPNKFCHANATCNNTYGSYTCACQKGYSGDGELHGTGCTPNRSFSKLITHTIPLIVSLSILVLFVASFNAYCGLRKRKLNKLKEQFFQQNGGLLLQQKIAKHRGSIETTKIFSIEELKKATNNFDEVKILGRGGYGIVYKGLLQDNTTVAIKKSKISDQSQIEQFINEVVILSQINHTNVVKLLGCCLETQVPLLVYEFIQGGTLDDHLHGQNQSLKLNWKTRLRIAAETAGALAYLHSATCPPIIHRDVKTTNILLDHNLKAKVSDFGASKIVPLDKAELSTLVQGTVGYLDPEYFHTSHLTEKSDVYSFGVVLAELLTGRKALCFDLPEDDRNLAMYFISSMNKGRLLQILDNQIRNEAKPEQLMEFANIAKRCLRLKGEERPTMKEVATELEGLRIMENHRWESDRSSLEETEDLLNASPSSSSLAFYSEDNGSYGRDIISRLESIGQISISLGGR